MVVSRRRPPWKHPRRCTTGRDRNSPVGAFPKECPRKRAPKLPRERCGGIPAGFPEERPQAGTWSPNRCTPRGRPAEGRLRSGTIPIGGPIGAPCRKLSTVQPVWLLPQGGIPEKVRLRLDRLLYVDEGPAASDLAPDKSGGQANRANPAQPRCRHRNRIQHASSPGIESRQKKGNPVGCLVISVRGFDPVRVAVQAP